MLTGERKKDLEVLTQWMNCAGDRYYYNMKQETFDKAMKGDEDQEYYKACLCQRKTGFEKLKADMAQKAAAMQSAAQSAEEFHYIDRHIYDKLVYI